MTKLVPVDFDPFAASAPVAQSKSRLTPVDYDPFAATPTAPSDPRNRIDYIPPYVKPKTPGPGPLRQAFMAGFGTGPIGMGQETQNMLRSAGVLPSAATSPYNPIPALNQAVIGAGATAADLGLRILGGGYRAAQELGVQMGLDRDIVSIPDAFMGSPGSVVGRAPGVAVATPLVRPALETAGVYAPAVQGAEVAGTAVKAAANLTAKGAAALGDTIAQPFRVVLGESAQPSLNKLAESIRKGDFAESLLKGPTEATENRIRLLLADQQISEAQATKAIQELNNSEHVTLARERDIHDGAVAGVGQVRTTLEAAPSVAEIGGNMMNRIQQWYQGTRGGRKSVAEAMYADADEAMAARHAQGDFWQQSPSGEEFLNRVKNKLSLEEGTQITTEERRLLQDQLLPNLEGRRRIGEPERLVETANGLELRPAEPGGVAFSTPDVLRETLRKLRDAASGRPEEGYAAIGQQRAGALATDLAKSISDWEKSLAEADARYSEMSALLDPAKTTLGSRALKGERYDYTVPAADPSTLPQTFFKTPFTVQQLVKLTGGDAAAVEQMAADYALRELSAVKDADAGRAWVAKNREWLNQRTLPEATQRVEALLAKLEEHEKVVENISKGRAAREKTLTENIRRETEKAAEQTKEIKASQALLESSQNQLKEAFDMLEAQLQNGSLTAERLPDAVRQVIKAKSRELPADVAREWNVKLDEIDRMQKRDKAYTTLRNWMKRSAILGTGIGGAAKGVLHVLGL
jgi:hypothetical protein